MDNDTRRMIVLDLTFYVDDTLFRLERRDVLVPWMVRYARRQRATSALWALGYLDHAEPVVPFADCRVEA